MLFYGDYDESIMNILQPKDQFEALFPVDFPLYIILAYWMHR